MVEPRLEAVEPRKLPELIEVDPANPIPPHSPRELSILREQTGGRSFEELAGKDADPGDRETLIVWFRLRRLGFEPDWEEARDVLIDFKPADPPGSGP